MIPMSYPRRQRNRRLVLAFRDAVLAGCALLAAGAMAGAGIAAAAGSLLLISCLLAVRSRSSVRLARRSAVGLRSEQRVRAELHALSRQGWQVRHSFRWSGGGDVDHLAIGPQWVGMAFPIETKTRSYVSHDLARITAIAMWLVRRRPTWCREGAVPILCLARARGVERWEAGVAVVSSDRLVAVLTRLAGTTPKPGFLR